MIRNPFVSSPIQRRFIRSTYVTLAIASVGLAYSEWELMPSIGIVAAVSLLMMLIAYGLEGRWSLTILQANVVGGIIAVTTTVWAMLQIFRPNSGLMREIPWPASMLPLLGPVILILLPAKLFRPKQIADYWGLHFIGLICMALGCILADDALFAVLLVSYLFCAMWSLALFLLHRNQDQALTNAVSSVRLPRRSQLTSWAVPIMIVAFLAFMATPRSGNSWQMTGDKGRTEVGIPRRPAIDLSRSGRLELNRDVAFEVYAQDNAGFPKLDLDPFMRWRGQSFRYYYNGRWSSRRPPVNADLANRSPALANSGGTVNPINSAYNATLPDLGPDQFFLTYQLHDQLRFPFLAAPIVFPADSNAVPVIQIGRSATEVTRLLPNLGWRTRPGRSLQHVQSAISTSHSTGRGDERRIA